MSDGTEGAGSASAFVYVYPTQNTVLTAAQVVALDCYAKYYESDSTNVKSLIETYKDGC